MSAQGFGVLINNYEVFGQSYDSVLGTVNLGFSLVDGETHKIDILHYPGERVIWRIDGVFKAQQTTLTSVPSGQASSYVQASLANNSTADMQMFVGDINIRSGVSYT